MCIVGKETVAVAAGCQILFYNVETGATDTHTANGGDRGDGVACIAGLRSMAFVALAEKALYPRVLVFFYPSLESPVAVLKGSALDSILSLAFIETEYLVTLSGIPDFSVVVWAWRSGVKVACRPTGVEQINQHLSPGSFLICQTSMDSPQVIIWELNVSGTACTLIRKDITHPKDSRPLMSCFTPEGIPLILDEKGNVHQDIVNKHRKIAPLLSSDCFEMSNVKTIYIPRIEGCGVITDDLTFSSTLVNLEDLFTSLVIDWRTDSPQNLQRNPLADQTEDKIKPYIISCKDRVIVSGKYKTVKCFEHTDDWEEVWLIESMEAVVAMGTFNERNQIVGWTESGVLVQLEPHKPEPLTTLNVFGMDFLDAVMSAPPSTIVSVDRCKWIRLWSKVTGELLGEMNLDVVVSDLHPTADPLSLQANPRFPYVAVTMTHGIVVLINVLLPQEPSVLATFHLCDNFINFLRFTATGDGFVAVSSTSGKLFYVVGEPGGPMIVTAHGALNVSLVDVVFTGNPPYPLLALVKTEENWRAGNLLLPLSIDGAKIEMGDEIRTYEIFTQIICIFPQRFYATAHLSRFYYKLFMEPKGTVKVTGSVASGHLLLNVGMADQGDNDFLTYSMAGTVVYRSTGQSALTADTDIFITHHRADLGVKRAMRDSRGDYFVALGRDGTLVSVLLKAAREVAPENLSPSQTMVDLFSRETKGFVPEGEDSGLNWLEYQEKLTVEAERVAAAAERAQILEGLEELRETITSMLDANEKAPEDEHLPVSAFDLDTTERENDFEMAKDDRENLRLEMLAEIVVFNRLADLVTKECWENLIVKPTTILSLVGAVQVDNYPMYPDPPEHIYELNVVKERRKLELLAAGGDYFHPWKTISMEEKNQVQVAEADVVKEIAPVDEKTRMLQLIKNEEGDGDAPVVVDDEFHMSTHGTTSFRFVESSTKIISQLELNTYIQSIALIVLLREQINKLMEYFNDAFNVMYENKAKELHAVHGMHEKIHQIFSELQQTCGVSEPGAEPKPMVWSLQEKPEMWLIVEDSELSVRPYGWQTPPSMEENLDDEDRQFRERALMKMMGGVLEVRWEDQLKKDVPKPKFMLEKDPENYTEDEVKQYLEYLKKVEELHDQREHYRKILISQYRKVKHALKESNIKFENKLDDLRDLKLKVEAAKGQTTLRMVRAQLLNTRRAKVASKVAEVRGQLAQNARILAELQASEARMHEAAAEIRNLYDTQVSRDRIMDNRFKKDLPEASPLQMEHLQRAYRKRPKMQQRALVSAHLLNELARCVATAKKPPHLPHESLEILKGLDVLDGPTSMPTNMNPELWASMCRLRRHRIESELKVKSLALQIVEAENTASVLHKSVRAMKERDKELNARLKKAHEDQTYFERDVEMQLVLKQGQVEIPMVGRMSDYENCLMIDRTEVVRLNELVLAAGNKKLQEMRADCNFRRGIIFKEWEHKKMKMIIDDLEEELNGINSAKVTKEAQEWLSKRLRGISDEKQLPNYERELARISAGMEKYIKDLARTVKEYDDRVEAQNRINERLQEVINDVNYQLRELQAQHDPDAFKEYHESRKRKMNLWLTKSGLVLQVRELDIEVKVLKNELKILRRRYYPVLKDASRYRWW